MRILLIFLCLFVLPVAPVTGQDKAAVERQFRDWLGNLRREIKSAHGMNSAPVIAALEGLTLDWSLPDLVPPGSTRPPQVQRQAEFGSPGRYFAQGGLAASARTGREMARRHAAALKRAEAQTGVPGHIILAIWARESNYGRAKIPHDALRVLATKAFMSTRRDYFRAELIDALRIVDKGLAPPGRMKSSWAGALGQPQFMPSNYLRHARDGDGDGVADIWNSEADTIASIAAYLEFFEWRKGRDWGFEVEVPEGVSCTLNGPDQGRPIADWVAMGIKRASGRPFPAHELKGEGYLLMPAGRHGPAFVVTPNFYVLKEYNFSDLYALYVGHLGDRIAYGSPAFRGGWDRVSGLSRGDVYEMQKALVALGHDVGRVDGLVGFKTRRSIGRWQEAQGKRATCFPDAGMKAALLR